MTTSTTTSSTTTHSALADSAATQPKTTVQLEHVNLTVSDPDASAALLGELFGWHVRWTGGAKGGGYTVHVGTDGQYVALYRPPTDPSGITDAGYAINGLNHIAVVVDDLDEIERRVRAANIEPFSFGDYEPGRRFYFLDRDGVEFEVVSYQ